jgi:Tetracyclin repressor-like, C-terminal domain
VGGLIAVPADRLTGWCRVTASYCPPAVAEQVAIRAAAETDAAKASGGAWERLLARSVTSVRFGLEHPGHYKVLFEGRVVPRLNDPRIASFGRPLLVRSIELIREIPSQPGRISDDPERLSLLLWSGLHGVISLRINKPTLDWPPATELAEQITRTIIQPKVRKQSPAPR